MKLTRILCRQHIDRMFKAHWRVQGKRTPVETTTEKTLRSKGFTVLDANVVVADKKEEFKLNIVGIVPKRTAFDRTHPNWHDDVCYFYRDNNVLLEGINQAKIITKTIELTSGLPESIENAPAPSKDLHKRVQRIIMSSHVFETEQEKLPKIKDSLRPAFNFPRVYGITNDRTNNLLVSKLLQLCETSVSRTLVNQRTVISNANFFVPLHKGNDLLQLELSADKLLMAMKPLDPISAGNTDDVELPDIFPIKHTITLVPENIYETNNIYPLNNTSLKLHPHTIFVHYDHATVQNVYEEPVEEAQILGRSLMKTFAAAAAHARQKFGNDVKVLPQPITLQCVHTDSKQFHFAILQLNSLDLENGGIKNVWYSTPRIQLFEKCEYRTGKPVIEGYNPDVIRYLLAFYNNV